jgi:transposase, IS30 family
MKYTSLSYQERKAIEIRLREGMGIRGISRYLKRSPSSVSREISRYPFVGEYDACLAELIALRRMGNRNCRRKIDKNNQLRKHVISEIKRYRSPNQIANRIRIEYPDDEDMRVSADTIYTYLYVLPRGELKKELISCLRKSHKARKHRKSSNAQEKRGKILDMISIEERPADVASRSVPGHWEGDILLGKRHKSALGTIVERKTRSLILVPLKGRDAATVRKAFEREMKTLPRKMKLSLTYDQGKEMAEHKLFTKNTKIKVYFAHPRSPWERGTNENTNGLLRQFFPKGTDFTKVSRKEINKVQKLMNTRPRKVLGYYTPQEKMAELLR